MATLKRKSPELINAQDATPSSRPAKKLCLTQGQKQALIDNLQLEITERARKLRSQYALHASDLRARIERRVNRIPVSLRKANMGELLEKYSAQAQTTSPLRKTSPAKSSRAPAMISIDQALSPAGTRDGRTRRTSNEGYSDKENAPASGEPEGLKNPKRRGKAPAVGGTSRVVSQEVRGNDHRILSPKSLNSRTYPQSPFRASPEKGQPSYLSRPTSPLKPFSPLRAAGPASRPRGATTSSARDTLQPAAAKKATARSATGPRSVKSPLPRPATRQGERKNSFSSTASSGTTVTKSTRTGTGARKATAGTASTTAKKAAVPRAQAASMAVKKSTSATAASMRKITAPAATTEASSRGTRALRKRI
ncbi:hypothetical protein N7462_000813 [Penicillium macrosclerotiorum]|uniref:uncharacterized protein n=1 Tax=Penicillium macrosclerotiorum TaxID=303699 RepID=UPI002547D53E|nr:uncharacterized protein N7462_000813 [Penicillium macrosclerotiorum]KAJ5698808.1 hypothetical protein N7462_000813 [Penicillium macrosclerotiorum]